MKRAASRSDAMLGELKRSGFRLTPQRMAIVRELADDRTHPTAQDLFDRLRPGFPTMSFATVYNTLDALARCGLTGSLHLGGAVRFDPNGSPHHHAVCDACGAVEDIPVTRAREASAEARVLAGEGGSSFHVRSEERTYRGLCGRCSSSRERPTRRQSWQSH
jgi:Fur family peroxide stress response transcriptional regulator